MCLKVWQENFNLIERPSEPYCTTDTRHDKSIQTMVEKEKASNAKIDIIETNL